MKKIGVITFSKSINYGAYLQAYALQKTIKKIGYEPSLIDYENPVDIKRYRTFNTNSLKSLISSMVFAPVNISRKRKFKKDQKALSYSPINQHYDVAISGSDQVWNPKLTGNSIDEKFFLKGIDTDKKISYAASVANEKVIRELANQYTELLNDFDHVSVRETTAKTELEKITNKTISVVADPTLLLTQDEWLKEISHIKPNTKPYIFTYFVSGIDKRENNALTKVSNRLGLKCITYSKMPREKNIYRYSYTKGPLYFLSTIRDSKLVLTSSFHGIVLSIMMHKNFYYFLPRADRRSRIDSILGILGFTDRIIETEADLDKINLDDIDYTEPQKKLDALREDSLDWLKNAIEN